MDKISTLELLLEKLPQCSEEEYRQIAPLLDIPESEFDQHAYWLNDRYSRVLISRSSTYELILLCWEPGQDTPIHCHNSQECWVYAVQGSFNEKRYSYQTESGDMALEDSLSLEKGEVSFMSDEMGYHSLSNSHSGRTLSLHLYINPIDKCRIYQSDNKSLVWKNLHYDNVLSSDK